MKQQVDSKVWEQLTRERDVQCGGWRVGVEGKLEEEMERDEDKEEVTDK